jgi:hypothetical protein
VFSKKYLFLLLPFMLAGGAAWAQPDCTVSVRIAGQQEAIAGEEVTYRAILEGATPDTKVTYSWIVEGGKITGGQGTPVLSVRSGKRRAGKTVTGVIQIGGLQQGCEIGTEAWSTTLLPRNRGKKSSGKEGDSLTR